MINLMWILLALGVAVSSMSTQVTNETVLAEGKATTVGKPTLIGIYHPYFVKFGRDGRVGGVNIDVWNIVADKLGVELVYRRTERADRLVRDVVTGKADLVATQIGMTPQVARMVDYSVAVYFNHFVFIVPRPGMADSLATIARPLGATAWLLSASSVATVFVFVSVTTRVAPQLSNCGHPFHHALLSFVLLLAQRLPSCISYPRDLFLHMTVLVLSCLVGHTFLMMAYESNLRASLITTERKPAVNTLQGLLDNDYTLRVPNGTSLMETMRSSPLDVVGRIYRECVVERNGAYVATVAEGNKIRDRIESGEAKREATMLTDSLDSVRDLRLLEMSKESFSSIYSGYILGRKAVAFKERIDAVLMRLRDHGLFNRLQETYQRDRAKTGEMKKAEDKNKMQRLVEISLRHCTPMFGLWAIGVAAGLTSFAVEFR